jgi:hypothetical protein
MYDCFAEMIDHSVLNIEKIKRHLTRTAAWRHCSDPYADAGQPVYDALGGIGRSTGKREPLGLLEMIVN